MRFATFALVLTVMLLNQILTALKLTYILSHLVGEVAPLLAVTIAGTEIAIIVVKSTLHIPLHVHIGLSVTSGLFHLLVALAVYFTVVSHGAEHRLAAESLQPLSTISGMTPLLVIAVLLALVDCAIALTLTTLLAVLLRPR